MEKENSPPSKSFLRSRKRRSAQNDKKPWTNRRVKQDSGHTLFPNELWEKIILTLPLRDVKSMTLVCKVLCDIARKSYWEFPLFKKRLKPKELETLIHLPIKKIRTKDLLLRPKNAEEFRKIFQKMVHLEEMVLSADRLCEEISVDCLKMIAPYVTYFNTDDITCKNRTIFVDKLARIDFPKLRSVKVEIYYHPDPVKRQGYQPDYRLDYHFTADHLRRLEALPITEITVYSLKANVQWSHGEFGLLRADPKENEPLLPQLSYFLNMKHLRKVWIDRINLEMIPALDREALAKLHHHHIVLDCKRWAEYPDEKDEAFVVLNIDKKN